MKQRLVKKRLFESLPMSDVTIHVNPHEPEREHKDLIRFNSIYLSIYRFFS
jgi:divalent metal cation (Fe/Co/Zn/Cd) transporter